MFEIESKAARRLARHAGEITLDHYAREIIAEEKLGVDNFLEPVTAADREASRYIVGELTQLFPGDAILSEEEADDANHRLSKNRVWIIDPIDGTAGFVKRDGDFSVQIGLAENGVPVLGVVYLPFHDILYHAVKGGGSFSFDGSGNENRLIVSAKSEFNAMNLAITRNHASKNMGRIVEAFGFRELTKRGSVGLKVGLIADRTCDIYIHPSSRTKLWDTCAPQIILEEAGGRLTDLFGFPLAYDAADLQNHNGILATNGTSHEKAVERMRPLLAEFGRRRVPNKKKASSR